jgi:hypothetical protein
MWLVLERFLGIVGHWARTGEWKSEEFRVRGPRVATAIAWLLAAAFLGLCLYIAIEQT